MSDRALMRREEAKFLEAAQRVLQQGGFPNPERTGCPDESTLKAIAFREVSPDQVMDWIDHLGFCSPCYKEYACTPAAGSKPAMDSVRRHRSLHYGRVNYWNLALDWGMAATFGWRKR